MNKRIEQKDEPASKDLILEMMLQDQAYWKKQKRHRFSKEYRSWKRKFLREIGKAEESEKQYEKLKLYPVRKKRWAFVFVVLAALMIQMTVSGDKFNLGNVKNTLLYQLDDHIQFSELAADSESSVLSNPQQEETDAPGSDYYTSNEQLSEDESQCDTERDMAEELRRPTYVLEGYEICNEEFISISNIFHIDYMDEKGQTIQFYQVTEIEDLGCTTNGEEMETELLEKQMAVVIPDEQGQNAIIWNDDFYYYIIRGTLSTEELVRIAESVEK